MIAEGQLDGAIDVLAQGRAARPASLAIAEALGEALAAAGKWTERAKLFAELAHTPGDQLDAEVAQLRSALAWEEAVGAATAAEAPSDELAASTKASLDAWSAVLERDPQSPTAHAAAIVLASRMGDTEVYSDVLARAQAAERSQWTAASYALRRVRLVAASDAAKAEAMARDIQPPDDPRRTLALVLAAARKRDYGDAALALEDRANQLDQRGAATEVAALRLRAAQLALDDNDAPRATRLLQQVEQALPHLGVVPDLLAAARRRAGDRPSPALRRTPPTGVSSQSSLDAFARVLHDADLASQHGESPTALALYQQALEMRPNDPLATLPMIRTATELRETAPITSLAFGQMRAAEEAGDTIAKSLAYELLAMVDAELRGDPASAQEALESASQADPSRIDLLHRLERHYATGGAIADLLRVRKASLDAVPEVYVKDRTALQLDVAGLATRDDRSELEIADVYRQVLAGSAGAGSESQPLHSRPSTRLALLHLESIVRRSGSTEELAELEQQIAAYFEGDPRSQAAFWTRAGETLAELGKIDDAVQRFGKAEAVLPGHAPALEGWRQAALKGQLWVDVADAANRQAAATDDHVQKAALYHFAGVTLMDKALMGEQAMAAFKRCLDADPGHKDAFLRMRILIEEDANHDDLATLLAHRLDVETDPKLRIEMHRALAELHRNFLSDRDTAKQHYRMILESDPNDLRAHAAVADISWEQGNWQEAADSLMSRARLEREPEVLKTLCFRLGLIYADRLVDVPMALKAFQRALTYQSDDEQTLVRLADLATQAGEWKLALGACERLVKNETDPDIRAQHLHRVARIFRDGFNDTKRAERALNLALDGAPTNDDALTAVVAFYKEQRDITSVRVHLNRVAGAMRARAQKDPKDGIAYRVISRAMMARASTNTPGSRPIARAAAELADLLGGAGEQEHKLIQEPHTPDLSMLVRPEADEVLFPRGVQLELRQIFQLLGDRIAKHVGVDLRPYGVARGDRLKPRESAVASVAQTIAHMLGYTNDIDVYVSNRQPWAMVAEPTSPVSLILGSAIANAGGDAIRFAAGGALKLAQSSLAIPARLPLDDLGILTVALLRLFQPEFPDLAVDEAAIAAQMQKLKRLIPTSLLNELKPYALAVDALRFGPRANALSRDLKVAGLRAGLVASGSLLAGLRILSGANEAELSSFLADPVAQGLVTFALGEDHAAVAR
jgi:tetratricopeptide (TPR) repeat protein